MYELFIRVGFSLLAFVVIVLAIILYAERQEKLRAQNKNSELRDSLKAADMVNRTLQNTIEDLLDERNEYRVRRDIADAIIKCSSHKVPVRREYNAVWVGSDDNKSEESSK